MASLWSSKPIESVKDNADVADTGLADVGLPAPNSQQPSSTPSGRPQLARNQTQPPPPHQPPPPPAPQQSNNPNDSLSLMQLRRIVTEFPKVDPTAYAFTYADTASLPEEIDEWFSYNEAEYRRLQRAKETHSRRYKKFAKKEWLESDEGEKKKFAEKEIKGLQATDLRRRCKSLQTILHVILGVWNETAGEARRGSTPSKTTATTSHLEHIKKGIELIAEAEGIIALYQVMQNAFRLLWDDDYRETQLTEEDIPFIQDELDNVTTIFYMIIEGVREDPKTQASVKVKLLELNPSIVEYFVTVTAKLRWDEAYELPQTRIFLLFWKSLLLLFGGCSEVETVKSKISETRNANGQSGKLITASPLDYHIFRQEITSKYPAYTPPKPLLPLEPENHSILPPLPNKTQNGANGISAPAMNVNSSGTSILHQPVHIATPAPSPPPSPAVGGKAGKKQNYQTNQNFPFMYPPLDSTSNSAGGKGISGQQGQLVSRKWEGSEIPKSILEAGELFSGRMRMTRAMRQLWDEREKFLKFERGWNANDIDNDNENNDDIEDLDLDEIMEKKLHVDEELKIKADIDFGPGEDEMDDSTKKKIELIETFYQNSIPHLQSLVIVLLKAILANVTALITQPNNIPQSAIAPSYRQATNLRNGQPGQQQADPANVPLPNTIDPSELPIEEVEALRSREITAKAVSGILLVLLKWLKLSHILKFEYLTQLLLDSNYLPLVLKLFAHQEIDKVVDSRTDREEMSFFSFCNTNSKSAQTSAALVAEQEEDSPDEAAPPPIKSRRDEVSSDNYAGESSQNVAPTQSRKSSPPAVDEMGYPTDSSPQEPITDFSWRNFFSSINFLRIMQKICKNKAHRNLLLVQYKSSNILKKSLKVPQHELRLYTLKLFKNQVPYCGRKWRQGNMRVITAVYLHCRPELRDDWLAGSDIDAEVEEALPLEQALRALTHWYNVERYPAEMGADTKMLAEERDFFTRELEKMVWIGDGSMNGGNEDEDVGSLWDGVGGGAW